MKLTLALAALAIGTATFSEASLSHSQAAAPVAAVRRHHAKIARDNTTESDFELTRRGGCSGFGTYYNVQTGNQGCVSRRIMDAFSSLLTPNFHLTAHVELI